MSIKAIGFDLDDTLYSRKDFYKRVFDIMQASVVKVEESFDAFFKIFQVFSDNEYEKFIQRSKQREEYKNDRVIETYKHFGKIISLNEAIIFNSLYLYFRDTIIYRNGVENLLDFFSKENYELFILTNGPSGDQRRKLEQLKVERYIPNEKWFISDEMNSTKPNREIFQAVEKALGYKGEEVLYIGDDLENDIIGAQNSNWKSIYLNVHELNNIPIETKIVKEFEEILEFFQGK